jgi:hypothetical protein
MSSVEGAAPAPTRGEAVAFFGSSVERARVPAPLDFPFLLRVAFGGEGEEVAMAQG